MYVFSSNRTVKFLLKIVQFTSALRESRDNKATKAVIWRKKLIKIDREAYIAKVLTAGIGENAPEIFIFHITIISRRKDHISYVIFLKIIYMIFLRTYQWENRNILMCWWAASRVRLQPELYRCVPELFRQSAEDFSDDFAPR